MKTYPENLTDEMKEELYEVYCAFQAEPTLENYKVLVKLSATYADAYANPKH